MANIVAANKRAQMQHFLDEMERLRTETGPRVGAGVAQEKHKLPRTTVPPSLAGSSGASNTPAPLGSSAAYRANTARRM